MNLETSTLIIGAGPAGLTAGVELVRRGNTPLIIESTEKIGGISRTEFIEGWRFDLGGHRFFTKNERVTKFWQSVLSAEEFPKTSRRSRIYYQKKFFDYPLKPVNALLNLGLRNTFRAVLSYLLVRIRPIKDQSNFETWVASRFGWYLYRTFFKTYTEKVWGIEANKIQADWAAQRIKNLSLSSAILSAFFPKRFNKGEFTTLVDEFHYPIYGPGMMWEECAKIIETSGGKILFKEKIVGLFTDKIDGVQNVIQVNCENAKSFSCKNLVSSMALQDLIHLLHPLPPDHVLIAASKLRYRSFITVAIPVPGNATFSDNWIYIHSPEVRVGRIQNYGAWSSHLVKDGWVCLGLEYFVEENDELWSMSDAKLINLAISELETLGLVSMQGVTTGFVVRVAKAYPVYDSDYRECVETIRSYLSTHWPNLQTVGRNGLHRYNNQDHSMLTAMYAVDNLFQTEQKDVWSVNLENEYHETASGGGERIAPLYPKS
jgi:protoporphyrinogen oxidase